MEGDRGHFFKRLQDAIAAICEAFGSLKEAIWGIFERLGGITEVVVKSSKRFRENRVNMGNEAV
jgi:hypothetical protein